MAALIGPKKVHRYTVEFKIQAVRLSLHPEIQTQDVAHALDLEGLRRPEVTFWSVWQDTELMNRVFMTREL